MDDLNPHVAPAPVRRLRLAAWPTAGKWALLLGISVILVAGLEMFQLPAALLLGPMIAAILLALGEAEMKVPNLPFVIAQSVIGMLMARSLPASIFVELAKDWPIYLIGIGSVILVAAGLGILLTRLRILPGTTAVWGSAPGAASAMVLMADAYGDDARLVAFMTYLRVALVAIAASLVARFATPGGGVAAAAEWFPAIDWVGFAGTMAVVAVGIGVALFTKIRAGGMLVPMFLGVALQDLAGLNIVLPPALLTVCYALLGWTIGLRFTREIIGHATRAFPAILGSMLALIAICGVFALLLVQFAGVDPLTAYLATSPGGADSVAIIAANTPVDLPFVMAMQAGRFMVVMFTGPPLARWIATRPWLHR
jgi:hypothetical protein